MEHVENRIDKIEQKLSSHDTSIDQLEKGLEDQRRVNAEILDKLNRLVYRDEVSTAVYDHQKLQCQTFFDTRYVLKSMLKFDVIEMIAENYQKKIDKTNSISYIINNIIDITWKVAIIFGGFYGFVSLLGG
jgi:uncharacterized coiled-coil protein SlyX